MQEACENSEFLVLISATDGKMFCLGTRHLESSKGFSVEMCSRKWFPPIRGQHYEKQTNTCEINSPFQCYDPQYFNGFGIYYHLNVPLKLTCFSLLLHLISNILHLAFASCILQLNCYFYGSRKWC